MKNITKYAWMAEWSKAADLSSVIFGCVGSNPTECNIQCQYKKKYIFVTPTVGIEPTTIGLKGQRSTF